jgi:hypothetical protein
MKKVASIKSANIAANNPATEPNNGQDNLLRLTEGSLLQLHQRLQGTLDTSTLINRFFSWLNEQQLVGGIEYIHPDENLALFVGAKKHHKAHYVLRLEQHYLGEITITGQKRFT